MERRRSGWWPAARAAAARVPVLVTDLALAALIGVLQVAELSRPLAAGSPLRPADPWGLTLVVASAVSLTARRRAPRLVLAVTLLSAALVALGGYRQSAFALSLVVALYTIASRVPARAAAPLLAGCAGLLVVSYLASPEPVTLADVVQAGLSLTLAWWVGASLRVRAAYAQALEDRAVLVQRIQDDTAAAAVVQERLRIARELHDVVAHSMSVVAVQSGVAMHLLDTRPDQARASLEAIVGTSRSALTELRRLLGVLRQDGSSGALSPSPGLGDLPALVSSVRAAGLAVDLRLPDPAPRPPPGIALSAYRIVQEALTNAIRHAGAGARAMVTLEVRGSVEEGEVLAIHVEDRNVGPRPRPTSADGVGAGLIGMRERVAVFGGRLESGPTADGFAVHALLPLEPGGRA